jgi:hypothetical protein
LGPWGSRVWGLTFSVSPPLVLWFRNSRGMEGRR